MDKKSLLQDRTDNFYKTLSPTEKSDYVPALAFPDIAVAGYSGKSVVDLLNEKDDRTIAEGMAAYYKDLYCDVTATVTISIMPDAIKALDGVTQMRYSADGNTLENIQKSPMKAEEYPLFIEDLERFGRDVLLPRRYPMLFEKDMEEVKGILRTVLDSTTRAFGTIPMIHDEIVAQEYGIYTMPVMEVFNNPMDILFDSFRGFKGLLTDLRRQKENVQAACDILWEARCNKFEEYEMQNIMAIYAAHILPYLNRQQFEEIYWPYQRKMITDFASHHNVLYHVCQGKMIHFIDYFKELPKNSVIVHVDDDDIVEVSKRIGDYQIVSGGAKVADMRLCSKEKCLDEAKRIIDSCAHTGSFIFTTDKALACHGDITPNLIETFAFAHEYGKQ